MFYSAIRNTPGAPSHPVIISGHLFMLRNVHLLSGLYCSTPRDTVSRAPVVLQRVRHPCGFVVPTKTTPGDVNVRVGKVQQRRYRGKPTERSIVLCLGYMWNSRS